jgi:PAS domain S-box-containing protein
MAKEIQSAIKIGFVEEFHGETDLIIRELKDSDMNFEHAVVSEEADFLGMLRSFQPDVILSPYSLKDTNAVKLLKIARESGAETPFILLAFDLSEDIAIDLLAEGIEDYVQRSTLKRLPVAIRKALQRYKTKLELQLSERKIRTSEQALRNMVRNAPIAVAMFDKQMNYLVVSEVWLKHEEKTEAIIGKSHYEVVPEIPDNWKQVHQDVLKGATKASEREEMVRADGSVQVLRWKMNPWYTSDSTVGGAVLFIEDITEQDKAQSALERSAATLKDAQSLGKLGSWELDLKTNKISWSDEMFTIHGLKKQAVGIELFMSVIHREDVNRVSQSIERAYNNQAEPMEYRIVRADNGEERTVYGSGARKVGDRLIGTVQDITENVSVLNQLEKDQYLLAIGEELGGSGSFEFDLATQTPRWSDNMYRIKGFESGADITHNEYIKHVHPEDLQKYEKAFSKIMELVAPERFEYRLIRPDNGQVVHLRVHSTFIMNGLGEPQALVGSVQDLTQIKESESALKVAQKIAKLGSWQWNKGDEYPAVSDEVFSIYETDKNRLSIDDIRSFIHPEDKARVAKQAAKDFEKDFHPVIEYRIITEKRNLKHVVTKAQQVKDKNGDVIQLQGTVQDVTKQKIDQEQIETLSLVASETVNGVLIHNPDGTILWANKGFERITGYAPEEIVGKEPWSVVGGPETNQHLVQMTYEKLEAGKSFTSDNQLRHKDGYSVWVNVSFTPILDDFGNVTKVVSIGTDITKQKETERLQREMLQKLEKANKELRNQSDN